MSYSNDKELSGDAIGLKLSKKKKLLYQISRKIIKEILVQQHKTLGVLPFHVNHHYYQVGGNVIALIWYLFKVEELSFILNGLQTFDLS